MLVIEKYYICSLRVKFLQNSCWYRATRASNSLLQLAWISVGMIGSMIPQLSDTEVLIHFSTFIEREKTKKLLFNGKTLKVNLERNNDQSGLIFCCDKCVFLYFPSPLSFLMNTQCVVGSSEASISRMLRIHHIPLLKLLYFSCKNDAYLGQKWRSIKNKNWNLDKWRSENRKVKNKKGKSEK